MAARRDEGAVESRLRAELAAAPAHGHGDNAWLAGGETCSRKQVVERVIACLDEEDFGARGNGVGPLHVESDLAGPPGIGSRIVGAAILIDLGKGRIGYAELGVELLQVVGDVRVVEGIDNGNGRAGAVSFACTGERNLIEAVGMADLRRRGACGTRRPQRPRRAGRMVNDIAGVGQALSKAREQGAILEQFEAQSELAGAIGRSEAATTKHPHVKIPPK